MPSWQLKERRVWMSTGGAQAFLKTLPCWGGCRGSDAHEVKLVFGCSTTVYGKHLANQLIWYIFHDLKGFIHPRWCRISFINSMCMRESFCGEMSASQRECF